MKSSIGCIDTLRGLAMRAENSHSTNCWVIHYTQDYHTIQYCSLGLKVVSVKVIWCIFGRLEMFGSI